MDPSRFRVEPLGCDDSDHWLYEFSDDDEPSTEDTFAAKMELFAQRKPKRRSRFRCGPPDSLADAMQQRRALEQVAEAYGRRQNRVIDDILYPGPHVVIRSLSRNEPYTIDSEDYEEVQDLTDEELFERWDTAFLGDRLGFSSSSSSDYSYMHRILHGRILRYQFKVKGGPQGRSTLTNREIDWHLVALAKAWNNTGVVRRAYYSRYVSDAPARHRIPKGQPPFYHDVLSNILLFLPMHLPTLLAVSHTCRSWRYFANYLPHWSHYEASRIQSTSGYTIARASYTYTRKEGETRDRIGNTLSRCRRDNQQKQRIYIRWAVVHHTLHMMLTLVVLMAMYGIYWGVGYRRDIPSDVGAVAAAILFSTLVWVVWIFLLLLRLMKSEYGDPNRSRPIILTLGVIVCLMLIGPPITLVARHVSVLEHMLSVPVANVHQIALSPCGAYDAEGRANYYVSLEEAGPLSEWSVNTSAGYTQYLQDGFPFTHLFKYMAAPVSALVNATACGYVNASFYRLDIALAGYNATALENSTALSYRGLASSEYYDVGFESEWHSSSNWLWASGRTRVIRGDRPESYYDGVVRLRNMRLARTWLVVAGIVAIVPFLVTSSLPLDPCHPGIVHPTMERAVAVTACVAFSLALNPLLLLAMGIVCYVKHGDDTRLQWALCDRSDGVAMIVVSSIIILLALILIACKLHR